MKLTKEQRAELKALAENDIDGGFVSMYAIERHHWSQLGTFREALPALLADLEEAEAEIGAANRRAEGAELLAQDSVADLATTRKQLAEAQALNLKNREIRNRVKTVLAQVIDDAEEYDFADGLGVGIPQGTFDAASNLHEDLVVEQSWDRFQDALDGCTTSALSAAIEAAVEPYKREAEKKAMLFNGCSRSHPHELMSPMCELRTEIARLTNLSENQRLELEKHKGTFSEELTDVRLINDTYNKVRKERDFAVDDLEYDLFAAGWKACAALSAKEAP